MLDGSDIKLRMKPTRDWEKARSPAIQASHSLQHFVGFWIHTHSAEWALGVIMLKETRDSLAVDNQFQAIWGCRLDCKPDILLYPYW